MKNNKIIATYLTLILIILLPINVYAVELSDIKGHWAERYIQALTDTGIISGYPNKTFMPDKTLTKAEFLSLFIKTIEGGDINETSSGHWAEKYYNRAIKNGVISKNLFSLNEIDEEISRLEMSVMISNALGSKSYIDDTIKVVPKDINNLKNEDVQYKIDLLNVYSMGIITGYPDGEFKPYKRLNRAEASVVIVRYLLDEYRVKPQTEEQDNIGETPVITTASELITYLNKNFSELNTSIGKTKFSFKIYENHSTYSEEDYWLMVEYDSTFFYNVSYSNQISREDRDKVKEELKQHQKNIGECVIKLMPNKKVIGGYYDSWYRYPTLKVDLITRHYYTWTNFEHANIMSNIEPYYQSKPSYFRWYDLLDNEL